MFKDVLVTGGLGFIGRWLLARLLKMGCSCYVLTRYPRQVDEMNCLRVHPVPIANYTPEEVSRSFGSIEKIDAVFHLGSYGVMPDERDSWLMFQRNIAVLNVLIHKAISWKVRSLVYTGSFAEYSNGIPPKPISEDYALTGHLYGASKAAAGLWAQSVCKSIIPFRHLRLFHVYGPGENDYRLFPTLLLRLKSQQKTKLSPGGQIRDLVYVTDAVEAIIAASKIDPLLETGPMNICSGIGSSVKEIAIRICEELEVDSELLNFGALDYRVDENMWGVGSPEYFHSITGWRCKTKLRDGVRLFVDALKKPYPNCKT